jgi:hypothetical protein
MYADEMLAKNPTIFQVHELLKTALFRENDRVQDGFQKLPNGLVGVTSIKGRGVSLFWLSVSFALAASCSWKISNSLF